MCHPTDFSNHVLDDAFSAVFLSEMILQRISFKLFDTFHNTHKFEMHT